MKRNKYSRRKRTPVANRRPTIPYTRKEELKKYKPVKHKKSIYEED